MAAYSEEDKHNAFLYARERLRQESIYRLKMSEPAVYSFINIREEKYGWRDRLGLLVEPAQELAPYRSITYDTSLLRCQDFSCIPVDVLGRPEDAKAEKASVSACNFAEHTAISIPLKNPKGDTIHQLTACGPACYRRQKKRNPHTGMPDADGTLLMERIDPDTGEKMCQYLNQNLILWAAVPWSRPGKSIEGYNTVHVPGFGFNDEAEEGAYRLFNRVALSRDYCNFFKRYYDDETGECYRSGWMKFVKFMFGQYFTNVSYTIINPQVSYGSINTWDHFLGRIGCPITSVLVAAGAAPSQNKKRMLDKRDILPDTQPPITERISNMKGKEREGSSNQESMESLQKILGHNRLSADKLIEVADSMINTALSLEVMGVDEKQARKLLLREMLKRSRLRPDRGGFGGTVSFSESLKIAGTILALKRSLFSYAHKSKRASRLSEEVEVERVCCDADDALGKRRRPETLTDREALLLLKASLENRPERPQPFLDPIPARDISRSERFGSSSEIWSSILKDNLTTYDKVENTVTDYVKNFMVTIVQNYLDILQGKIFAHGYRWENNIPILFGVDFVLQRTLSVAGKLCSKLASFAESRVAGFTTNYGTPLEVRGSVDISTRTFAFFMEETLVEVAVSSALRTAIQAFVALARLAASALTVLGVALTVVTILGVILDLALHLDWYSEIMTPKVLEDVVDAFEESFAQAAHQDRGHYRTVTAEEIVSIDVSIQMRNEADIRSEDGEADLRGYLEMAFHESPLLGKSSMTFVQESAEEYLAGRTMNAFGQRIIQRPKDDATAGIINKETRHVVSETANLLSDYSKVVNYNASRLDFVGAEWVQSTASKDGGASAMFMKTVSFAAAAGLALTIGLGGCLASCLTTVRMANIGMSIAFVGLLSFITLAGVAFINLNAMGESNARDILSLNPIVVNNGVFLKDRVGYMQMVTGVGARFNIFSDYLRPMLDTIIAGKD
uniref:Wsv115-like protein n=1 Tax=Trachysalambria curvirostris nimavirus TaxID=2984282 RepID=A0A9C7F0T3_9VIRU|nr:MAG: wsv115-like protein [Trachysalambria curvirostris nimavirus]